MARQSSALGGQLVVSLREADAHSGRVKVATPHPHVARAAVAALLLVGAMGCGQNASRSNAHASATSQTMRDAESWLTGNQSRSGVLPAVRAYWDAYLAITRQPVDATVATTTAGQVATGRAAAALIDAAGSDTTAGLVVRGKIISHPRVATMSETTASVLDCVDDRTGAYRADGTRVDADDPRLHQVVMTLSHSARGWRVATVDQPEGTCTPD